MWDDEREVEQLIKQAIEKRVKGILEEAAKEKLKRRRVGYLLATLQERLAAVRGTEEGQRSWAWEWAKAMGALLVPGTIFGLIFSSLIGSWLTVAVPALLISLSLSWR